MSLMLQYKISRLNLPIVKCFYKHQIIEHYSLFHNVSK